MVDINKNDSNLNKLNELLKKTSSDKSVSKEDTINIFSDANKNNTETVETNIFSNAFLNVFAKENGENIEDIEQEYLEFWEEVAAADGDAETISAEDLNVLFTQNEEQSDKTSAPSNKAEKTESSGDKAKEEINKELDDASIAVLNEIAAKYTDRTDLTEEDYEHILAIEQVSQNFYSLYGQYRDELSTEGWIDNVYNSFKDLFGGITREMIQEEFDNYFEQIDAMKKVLNRDTEGTQNLILNELERKLGDKNNWEKAQDNFIQYCGSKDKALEIIKNWLEQNTDRLNNELFMDSSTKYTATIHDGEITIKETQNGNLYFSLTLNEAAANFGCIFNPLEIIKDNEEIKDLAPSDFNSVWEFYNGFEYNPDKMEEVTQKGYEFTQINIGLSTAYNIEQQLKNTTPQRAFDIFKEQYNGDEESAIEAFNKYYSSVMDELGNNKYTEPFDNKLTQIRAQKNDSGEIEFIARYEAADDSEDNSSLSVFGMLYDGESDFCEFNLNFSYDDSIENPAKSIYVGITNDIFMQINYKVAKDQLLQNRYKSSFKEANNGYTVEEALKDYADLRTETFGSGELEKMLNEYISDMDTYSQKLSAIMSIGGIGLSFVCPAFGYVALAGVLIDNTIDGINMATNEKQGEDWQSLVQNTFKEAAFMAIGMGINATAQSAHKALTKVLLAGGKSAKMAATAGTALEVSIDGALSVGFDVLTTGSLNLSGNSIGLLMDIVSGIRGYKAICANRAAADTVDVTHIDDGSIKPNEIVFNSDGTGKIVDAENPSKVLQTIEKDGKGYKITSFDEAGNASQTIYADRNGTIMSVESDSGTVEYSESGEIKSITGSIENGDITIEYTSKSDKAEVEITKEDGSIVSKEDLKATIKLYVQEFDKFIFADNVTESVQKMVDYINSEGATPTYESTHVLDDGSIASTDKMPEIFRDDILYRGIKSKKEIFNIIEKIGGQEQLQKYINEAIENYRQNPNASNNGYQTVIKLDNPIIIEVGENRVQSYTPNRWKSVSWSMNGDFCANNRNIFTDDATLSGVVMTVTQTDAKAISVRDFYKNNSMELPKEFDQNEFILSYRNSQGEGYKNIINSIVISVNQKKGNSTPSYSIFFKSDFGN